MTVKHLHRYKLELNRSVVGLKHVWFSGHCMDRSCTARIDNEFIDAVELKQGGQKVIYWYLDEKPMVAE